MTYSSSSTKLSRWQSVSKSKMSASSPPPSASHFTHRVPNSELLNLLLDLNDSTHIPSQLCYGLHTPPDDTPALHATRDGTPPTHPSDRPGKTLESLLNIAHTPLPSSRQQQQQLPEDLFAEPQAGYLTPTHEEDYLANTDAAIGSDPLDAYRHGSRLGRDGVGVLSTVTTTAAGTSSSSLPSEKDIVVQNPNSVYNWLRRNQPHVFIQEREREHETAVLAAEKAGSGAAPAASASKAARAGGKKAGAAAAAAAATTPSHAKSEQELLDEEIGFVPEVVPSGSARGKKKRDDEPYRPKGGSSRSAKRKRDDGDKAGGGGRKKVRTTLAERERTKWDVGDGMDLGILLIRNEGREF